MSDTIFGQSLFGKPLWGSEDPAGGALEGLPPANIAILDASFARLLIRDSALADVAHADASLAALRVEDSQPATVSSRDAGLGRLEVRNEP